MILNSLLYTDSATGLEISFSGMNPGANLLTGVSGSGKTTFLRAISNLKKIALGQSLNGILWDVKFTINDNLYTWKGEFEYRADIEDSLMSVRSENFKLLNEFLAINDEILYAKFPGEIITFKGNKMPKVSSKSSLITIFEEEETEIVKREFRKIKNLEPEKIINGITSIPVETLKRCVNTSHGDLVNSNLQIIPKLFCGQIKKAPEFEQVKKEVQKLFPEIEDISFGWAPGVQTISKDDNEKLVLKVKIDGEWVDQTRIASGIFKFLIYVGEFYYSPVGAIFLIDDIENNLNPDISRTLVNKFMIDVDGCQAFVTTKCKSIIDIFTSNVGNLQEVGGGGIRYPKRRELAT